MVVVGQHAFVLSDTGRTAEVSAYTPDYNAMQVRIVDAGCWMLLSNTITHELERCLHLGDPDRTLMSPL